MKGKVRGMAEIRDESVIMARGVSRRVCTRTRGKEQTSESSVGIVLIGLSQAHSWVFHQCAPYMPRLVVSPFRRTHVHPSLSESH